MKLNRLSLGCMAVYFAASAWALSNASSFEFTVAAERHDPPGRGPLRRLRPAQAAELTTGFVAY